MSHVLIVDDEQSICWGFEQLLTEDGHTVSVAPSAEEALRRIKDKRPDAIFLDVRLPGIDGLTAIDRIRALIGDVPIVVMTAFGNLDTAVKARRAKVDYLTKPFDLSQAVQKLERALSETSAGQPPVARVENAASDSLIGSSPAMQQVFKQIAIVATGDVPVLVTGESGTGKEVVAQAIHRHGPRHSRLFVPICLAALSETVIESELFGHTRGAFTGADRERTGMLELADGGTVLLDEIGDVPLNVQVKLLRAIERKEITPVGDPRPRKSDFRVIAATNRSLADDVTNGRFREDLYYRLSVFHIHMPPLRERREDIAELAHHFLQLTVKTGEPKLFTKAALAELERRTWQGNVRELRNAVEYAVMVSQGSEIDTDHLPAPLVIKGTTTTSAVDALTRETARWTLESLEKTAGEDEPKLYERLLNVIEPPLFETVVRESRDNVAGAARRLGMHRVTLRDRLRRYGIREE